MYQLRDYQEEMVAAAMAAIPTDSFILIQAATGAGKTIFFAELIKRLLTEWPQLRIGVVAHRSLLVEQAKDKLLKVWPEAPVGVACSSTGMPVDTDMPVVIGSVQTLARRMMTTAPFDVVFIDEAHRVPPRSHNSQYKDWLEKMLDFNPKMRVVGLTATPFRLGHGYIYGPVCRKGNKNWFNRLHYRIGIKDLQAKGFLCGYRAKETVDIGRDLSGVHVSGEFNLGELSDLMSKTIHVGSAVKALQEYGKDRERVIVFAVTIDHAKILTDAFESAGIDVNLVHSNQPADYREYVLDGFRNGKYRVLCSIGILTEGFDEPATDCIICCRPTKSAALHVQMCGRGLRPYPGKKDVLILDLSNNFKTHGDIDSPKINVRGGVEIPGEAPTKKCDVCGEIVHTSVRECPGCGYEWPEKEVVIEDALPKMVDVRCVWKKPEPIDVQVIDFDVEPHTSKAGNRMVKVHLVCQQPGIIAPVHVNHFLMFDKEAHPYARGKSISWWQRVVNTPVPGSTDEAMKWSEEIEMALPKEVRIMEDGKWWKVLDWKESKRSFNDVEVPF